MSAQKLARTYIVGHANGIWFCIAGNASLIFGLSSGDPFWGHKVNKIIGWNKSDNVARQDFASIKMGVKYPWMGA